MTIPQSGLLSAELLPCTREVGLEGRGRDQGASLEESGVDPKLVAPLTDERPTTSAPRISGRGWRRYSWVKFLAAADSGCARRARAGEWAEGGARRGLSGGYEGQSSESIAW